MKTKSYTLTILFFLSFTCFSQDADVFNSTQSLTYLNPSFAGSNGFLRLQSAHHSNGMQYVGYFSGFDAYIKRLKAGVGISAVTDIYSGGNLKHTQYNVIYAQHLSLMDHTLKLIPSVQLTYGQVKADLARIPYVDATGKPIPWSHVYPSDHKYYFEGSAGLLAVYKNFYAGATVFHINQPDIGIFGPNQLPARFTAHASYNLHVSEKTLVNFSAKYSAQQQYIFSQFGVNAVFFKHLIAGIGYLSNSSNFSNTVLANLGYRNNYMSASLGCEAGFSKYSSDIYRAYSLNLAFNLRNKEQRKQLTNFEAW